MNVNSFFLKRQRAERIDQEVIELFINIFANILTQNLILPFLLKFNLILNIPTRSKHSSINRRHFLNSLCNHLVLKVKSLNRSWDEIVTTYQPLLVLFVFLILLTNVRPLFVIGSGWQVESEDGWGLLKQNSHIFL